MSEQTLGIKWLTSKKLNCILTNKKFCVKIKLCHVG